MIAKFDRFTFDSGRRLLQDGDRVVAVPPKAFDLLELLIRRAPNVVTKDTIAAIVWRDEAPSDASVAMAVTELRRALGETAEQARLIRTVHRRGYAFSGDVERVTNGSADTAPATFWLVLEDRTLPLPPGETVVGRDPESAIRIDRPGISRSHARFIVDATRVWVEDLGSLNGTFVGGSRVSGRTTVHPGDRIAIGEVTVMLGSSQTSATAPTRPLRGRQDPPAGPDGQRRSR